MISRCIFRIKSIMELIFPFLYEILNSVKPVENLKTSPITTAHEQMRWNKTKLNLFFLCHIDRREKLARKCVSIGQAQFECFEMQWNTTEIISPFLLNRLTPNWRLVFPEWNILLGWFIFRSKPSTYYTQRVDTHLIGGGGALHAQWHVLKYFREISVIDES